MRDADVYVKLILVVVLYLLVSSLTLDEVKGKSKHEAGDQWLMLVPCVSIIFTCHLLLVSYSPS